MSIEKSLMGMPDLAFARHLDRNNVVPEHEEIPTLACAIDARPMDSGVAQTLSSSYYQSESETGVLYYSDTVGQKDGDPDPITRTPLGESSAK